MGPLTAHKILVADDDPADLEMTRIAISRAGLELRVETVDCGEAALDALRRGGEPPALVMLDLKMLGMSGIDTVLRMRADERLRDIKVVILTNSVLDSDRNAAYAAGADGYIHKAFDIDKFAREVRAALQRWLR